MGEVLRVTTCEAASPAPHGWVRVELSVTCWDAVPDGTPWTEIWETFEWFETTARAHGYEAVVSGPLFVDPIPFAAVDHLLARLDRLLVGAGLPQFTGSVAGVVNKIVIHRGETV